MIFNHLKPGKYALVLLSKAYFLISNHHNGSEWKQMKSITNCNTGFNRLWIAMRFLQKRASQIDSKSIKEKTLKRVWLVYKLHANSGDIECSKRMRRFQNCHFDLLIFKLLQLFYKSLQLFRQLSLKFIAFVRLDIRVLI